MRIAFFGSSLVSAYWNGAATYYRGLCRALAERGHRITFYEPDAYDRQQHRDIADPPWAEVVVYRATESDVLGALAQASDAEVVIKASGVGVFDELLEEAVPSLCDRSLRIYCDVDAPATLERIADHPRDPFRAQIPRYHLVITYGGGEPVVSGYRALGARECVPIYNALDPTTHFPVAPDLRFACDLAFLGNRLPDREARVDAFFLAAAAELPEHRFLLGGNGWGDRALPKNVAHLGHVYTRDHNALNSTARTILNVHRDSMVRNGWSPATRFFEAAGAGACMITDTWPGIDHFLEPGREVLVAASGREVAELVEALDERCARAIGRAARRRILAEHTYAHRAELLESVLEGRDQRAGAA